VPELTFAHSASSLRNKRLDIDIQTSK